MKSLQPRERILLLVVGLLAIVAVFYVFIYAPNSQEAARASQQLAGQRAELARLQALAQRRGELERSIRDLQSSVDVLEAKLPSAREIPNLLLQLDALASQSQVDLRSIRPGPLAPAVLPSKGPAPGAAGAGAASPPAKQPQQQQRTGYQQFQLDLSVEGPFDRILQFGRGVEDFPRFLAISDIRIGSAPQRRGAPASIAGAPRLSLSITATAYVLPVEGVR